MPKTTSSKKTVFKSSSKPNGKPAKETSKSNGKTVNKENQKKIEPQFATDADASLKELFIGELRETYWAENHLVKSIPKMVAAAGDKDLKDALKEHVEVTKTHASRLEQVFESLGEKLIAKKCDACEGLTMGGEHVIENTVAGTSTRDTGIIMSALKVENFEITTYKGLIQLAGSLGKEDVIDLLQQNLDEEAEASELLTEMSKAGMKEPA